MARLGILAIIISTYTVKSVRLLDEDLNNILDLLNPALNSRGKKESKVIHNDSNLNDISILKLIEQASNIVQEESNNRHISNNYRANLKSDVDRTGSVNINQLPALYKYLVSSLNREDDKRNEDEHDSYSGVNSPSNQNSDGKLDVNDYSKIYMMLDPEVTLKHEDIIEISDLVSSVFKSDSKSKRYKGFLVRDNSRRRRNSKESYSKRDSMEHDYKPKRARKEHQGGGRTAIPYIRQRGDIYEKPTEFD